MLIKTGLLWLLFMVCTVNSYGQNFHAQLYFSNLRPNYKAPILSNLIRGVGLGGNLAIGTNRYQIGIESEEQSAFLPFFGDIPDTSFQIQTSSFGGFIRANFSSIPAYRLGLVAQVGMRYFKDEINRQFAEAPDFSIAYPNKIRGWSAGIGFSGPIKKQFHWEFMYRFSYYQRPEITVQELIIPKHNVWQHALQFGISLNLVWGKAKREGDEMIKGRGW